MRTQACTCFPGSHPWMGSAGSDRGRATHARIRRRAFDGYDRGPHWIETCGEVAKLQIVDPVGDERAHGDACADAETGAICQRLL